MPAADVNFDDIAGLQGIVDKWTAQYAATSDMHDAAAYAKVPADKQVSARGIEVGHIFYFGTKYSEPMKAVVATGEGGEVPVHMGSYGIGPSRLVAAIIEASHDEAGIIWPEPVAPFKVAILNLKQGAADTDAACELLYKDLTAKGVEVLYRRPRRAGGGEIRHRRPDRHPLAGANRPARPGRGQGRGQETRRWVQGIDEPDRGARFAVALTAQRPDWPTVAADAGTACTMRKCRARNARSSSGSARAVAG